MYAKGITTDDIKSPMRELYDINISDSTISRISGKNHATRKKNGGKIHWKKYMLSYLWMLSTLMVEAKNAL